MEYQEYQNDDLTTVSVSASDTTAVGGDAINGSDGGDAIASDGETAIGGDGGSAGNTEGTNIDTTNIGEDGEDAINDLIGEDGGDGIVEIFRFFEYQQGYHFYTSSEAERDSVQQQIDNGELSYNYEGASFSALAEDDNADLLTGAKPVYRLFDSTTGSHVYTISEKEKNSIVDNLPNYSFEGTAFYAYDEPQDNTIPLYRLYDSELGTHFYTPSVTEKDNALESLPQYSLEGQDGIAFYVLPVDEVS